MFTDLIQRLTRPDAGGTPMHDTDARLALTALLVRLARSDGDYSTAERQRIDRVISSRYAMPPAEAAALRAEAERLEAEAPDTVRFTRAIKDGVAYDDRIGVIEALWDVVLADGERDAAEDSIMRMVAPMLGINDRDSNLARKRVEDRR